MKLFFQQKSYISCNYYKIMISCKKLSFTSLSKINGNKMSAIKSTDKHKTASDDETEIEIIRKETLKNKKH